MKQFFKSLFNKADALLEKDTATSNRPVVFKIAIITILSATMIFLISQLIKFI